ncbi:arginine--tRNA ligase [Pasteuria penetrans]|uniref:arginine--tRNA ligase n=1 Tax=Pasteuria penetrans TaxID=86005 RepID=UPI000FC10E6A|nr:arginine--tRNA ligase [Pasteuria penetrans]
MGGAEISLWQGYKISIIFALQKAIAQAGFPAQEKLVVETPRDRDHGDLATTVALQLARSMKTAPHALAEQIVRHLQLPTEWGEVSIAGPGFINITLTHQARAAVVKEILLEEDTYGHSNQGQGRRILLEYGSANPTGFLHLGHGRGVAVGDTLARIFTALGFEVYREYLVNDVGNQLKMLALSVDHHYQRSCGRVSQFPEGGYQGAEVEDIARKVWRQEGDRLLSLPTAERLSLLGERSLEFFLMKSKQDLSCYRVVFDRFFHESALHTGGEVEETLQALREAEVIREREGAVWLASSMFGDTKDRVLVKQDGNTSYLLPDIAYHREKFRRNFDFLINVWGSDHHGYHLRLYAGLSSLSLPTNVLEIVWTQMVRLLRGKEPVKLSKRRGNTFTLAEVIDEIGVDAARFFFLWRSPNVMVDVDLDLARSQTQDNPVYYIQYAHARICSLHREAKERGWTDISDFQEDVLQHPMEKELLSILLLFPEEVADAGRLRAPQRIATYLQQLAGMLHRYYGSCRVLDEGRAIAKARLALYEAVGQVIRNGLYLLGITAPEKM